jgi:endoglucanase
MKRLTLLILYTCVSGAVFGSKSLVIADTVSKEIRLNQLGFYPDAPKIAIITAAGFSDFSITSPDRKEPVFSDKLKVSAEPALNGKKTLIADFTSLAIPGNYSVTVKGLGNSFPFVIGKSVYHSLADASVKAYYYQRVSTELPAKFAGKWHRAAGHPDDKVFIHPSAATANRPAGTIIAAPGGWYDAGDYNKYIVNSGITMGTLLSLCEDFPDYIKTQHLNIPESGNKIPDVLNEVIYNLRWMLAMQDPDDGGVYNKLTNANFDAMVMPDAAKSPRYVVQKGTAATLDFAAVTAKASRTLKKYQRELPGLTDSCLKASVKAWQWAQANPNVVYDQNKMNARFAPQITTGGYSDRSFDDEMIWAAAELYITTGNATYYNAVNMLPDERMPIPSWANVRLMGYYALMSNQSSLSGKATNDLNTLKLRMVKLADDLISGVEDRAYKTVMGKVNRDFGWGSNSLAANQGMVLIKAYLLTKDRRYLDYALSNLDYLLGRNASGYSYITGFGHKTPMHPHHRISIADGIVDPVPGLMVGGPNPGMQDGIKVTSLVPDEAYVDDARAYAVNEVAINWNAPFVYLTNSIEAIATFVKLYGR